MTSDEFKNLLFARTNGLGPGAIDKLVCFRELVLEENRRQNLTRLTKPQEFFNGHVIDCLELKNSGFLSFPAMDLGSGAGVPGLLCTLLGVGPWILAESEKKKAEFLVRSARELGIQDGVTVFSGRAEDFLKKCKPIPTVVARAVGPVDRIYGWIRRCSTWNTLVLLKGPSWNDEWSRFLRTRWGKELRIMQEHRYSVGEDQKQRSIIQIERVLKR
jgi:16S rRNA (guanine527-N7)-methyltransferase